MSLDNKKVLITGGTSGLGKALAEKLVGQNAEVHVCSRSENAGMIKGVVQHECDVSDFDEVKAMVEKIGTIDVLINAAGVWLEGDLETYTKEQMDDVIDINLKGLIYSSRLVLPTMIKQNSGVIVNIASSSGLKAKPNETVYAASKWGVRGFTDSLREEVKRKGVRVIGVYPGGMATPFFEKTGFGKDNTTWMDPTEVAEVIIVAIEGKSSVLIDHIQMNRK